MRKIYPALLLLAFILPASFLNAQWTNVGSADFSGKYAGSTSVAFDNAGTPYVAFAVGNQAGKATVMKFTDGSWLVVGNAGFSSGAATGLSIAISHNVPIVSYSDA